MLGTSPWHAAYGIVSKPGQCLNLRPRHFLIYSIVKKNQKGDREIKNTGSVLNSLKSLTWFRPKGTMFFRLRSEHNQTWQTKARKDIGICEQN